MIKDIEEIDLELEADIPDATPPVLSSSLPPSSVISPKSPSTIVDDCTHDPTPALPDHASNGGSGIAQISVTVPNTQHNGLNGLAALAGYNTWHGSQQAFNQSHQPMSMDTMSRAASQQQAKLALFSPNPFYPGQALPAELMQKDLHNTVCHKTLYTVHWVQ